jgi:DNA-directed RNA polymerase subunit M/transcription elongation factor TFIIS
MIIDPEFAAMLGELTAEEERALRESIAQEGVREPVTVWVKEWECPHCHSAILPKYDDYDGSYVCIKCNGELSPSTYTKLCSNGILIDGHNRKRIAEKIGKDYTVRFECFADRDSAKRWIARNQLGRRNQTEDQQSYCRGILYNAEKKEEGRPEKLVRSELVSGGATDKKLADVHGVSPSTIRRDGIYAEAVDTAEKALPGTREKALGGFIPRQQVIEASRQVKQGDVDKAKATLAKDKTLREKLSNEMLESKRKKLETLPPRERARILLEAYPSLAEAVSVLIGIIPKEDRAREITGAIKVLTEASRNLQRIK